MNLRKMKKVISAAVSSAMLLTSLFTGFAPAISASAASGPDLIVTGITWSPSSPVTGNAVTFSCTVKNQGDTATPAGVVVGAQFQVDGTEVNWSGHRLNLAWGRFFGYSYRKQRPERSSDMDGNNRHPYNPRMG